MLLQNDISTKSVHAYADPQQGVFEDIPGHSQSLSFICWKRPFDFALALILLAAAAPVVLFVALLVKLTSRGPAFYTQTRVGQDGRHYKLHKIRTMRHNCERDTGPRWATQADPRVTLLGRVLRPLHLDELPQLWNVLRGEMSLVGPRPERPEFVARLEVLLPCYRNRLAVRPGLTGLAQLQLPPDSDLDSVRRKLAYDLYYVHRMSLLLDLRILLSTGFHLVHVPFRITRKLLQVPSGRLVEWFYESLEAHAVNALEVRRTV